MPERYSSSVHFERYGHVTASGWTGMVAKWDLIVSARPASMRVLVADYCPDSWRSAGVGHGHCRWLSK